MDAELVAFLCCGGTVVFAILAFAKDRGGKRYGLKRMALLWCTALPYFASSAFEFSAKHPDGTNESVTITYSNWFLLAMPIALIVDNAQRKRNRANAMPGRAAETAQR